MLPASPDIVEAPHPTRFAFDPSTPEPTLFSRERQAVFLAELAIGGQVRSAAARAGVSHQTAYRAWLASPGFRRACDAALLDYGDGALTLPRNLGKNRTPSKRALLEAIEDLGGRW